MACTVTNMNVTLPPLHTLFPASSLPSPSPSPTTHDKTLFVPSKSKDQDDGPCSMPRLPFPLSSSARVHHSRRISTSSVDSESSAPSLVFSPSPSASPPPSPPLSPAPFLLVPCDFHAADAVIISSLPSSTTSAAKPLSSSQASPIFRPCKPSEAKATLLIGPAISAHARKRSTTGERRMHPYRIVRERRGDELAHRCSPNTMVQKMRRVEKFRGTE